jgi:hypothetical protein
VVNGFQEITMDTTLGLRIEGLSGQGSGQAMDSSPRRRRRAHWLIDLVEALEQGDLDAARLQFAGLVQDDPGVSHHPLLHRIGNALQSSNSRMARQLAHELRDEGLAAWNDWAHAHLSPTTTVPQSKGSTAASPVPTRVHRVSSGQHIIDFRA